MQCLTVKQTNKQKQKQNTNKARYSTNTFLRQTLVHLPPGAGRKTDMLCTGAYSKCPKLIHAGIINRYLKNELK